MLLSHLGFQPFSFSLLYPPTTGQRLQVIPCSVVRVFGDLLCSEHRRDKNHLGSEFFLAYFPLDHLCEQGGSIEAASIVSTCFHDILFTLRCSANNVLIQRHIYAENVWEKKVGHLKIAADINLIVLFSDLAQRIQRHHECIQQIFN